jgi:single-strand DNA-binding protein
MSGECAFCFVFLVGITSALCGCAKSSGTEHVADWHIACALELGTPPSVIRLGQNTDCKRPRLKKSIHVARKASSMSRCVNTVTLLGNCGQDPDIRYTASGKPVAKLSLAINENYKDNQGNWQERTHWISVVAWQRLAQVVGDYVQQGTKLYVHGRRNTESWEDRRSGEKRYRMSVVAEKLICPEQWPTGSRKWSGLAVGTRPSGDHQRLN